jgi:hypothetical protein
MLLLRLCPLIPFNGLNYICGITGVSLHDFTLSLVGILPSLIFTAVVGATAGTLALSSNHNSIYSNSQQLGWIILICSGVAFGIIALVLTWKLVKKELQKVSGVVKTGRRRYETFLIILLLLGTRNLFGRTGILFAYKAGVTRPRTHGAGY